jgi:hypothetical protein
MCHDKLADLEIQKDNIERRSFSGKISDERADKFLLEVSKKERTLKLRADELK